MLVKRTSCPLLVLRVSSRCLIYKVHALPQRQELIQYIIPFCCCQVHFSNFFRSFSAPKVQIQNSHPAARRSRSELLYDIMSRFACQALFFILSSAVRRVQNDVLLCSAALSREPDYITTVFLSCQHIFSFFLIFIFPPAFCSMRFRGCPR